MKFSMNQEDTVSSSQSQWFVGRLSGLLAAIVLVGMAFSFSSCRGGAGKRSAEGDTISMKYARLLTMVRYADHVHVDIKDPWKPGHILHSYDIDKPFRRAAVFTSAHCQLLEYLGASNRIAGIADRQYILIPDIQKRIDEGRIVDLGNAMAPNVERIIDTHCDAIVISPFENSGGYGKLEKIGIPIIEAADYMEPTSLGRAEWMKFYGLLFGCERQADSLFAVVDSSYQSLRRRAAKLPLGRSVLTERKTGSTWYTPGGQSTLATIIRDAHGRYAFSDDKHSGSLALSFEQIIDKAGDTDVWAFKVSGDKLMSKDDLLEEFHGYSALKAFRSGDIYECMSSKVPYFEEVSFRPDYLLREMIQLLHPGVDLGGLRYYQKLNTSSKD
jgi:iron complex transport system substrate-binding protein